MSLLSLRALSQRSFSALPLRHQRLILTPLAAVQRLGHSKVTVRFNMSGAFSKSIMLPPSLEINCKPTLPKCRIELHVHLDGAGRHSTLYELLKAKNKSLPGNGSFDDFIQACQVKQPKDLLFFLSNFRHFADAYLDDPEAWRRISYEFCEDQARNGVLYFEARFSPHLMCTPDSKVSLDTMVQATLDAFKQGEKDFGVKGRALLCCIRGRPHEAMETLRLCDKFRDQGVVGIDIAGDEGGCVDAISSELKLDAMEIKAFQEAKKLGIHRTVHAGEAGPPEAVKQAVDILHAERIGHGYRVIGDEKIYKDCQEKRIHFETCPSSSLLTGSVDLGGLLKHPILQFAEDNVSFSINTDDPTISGTFLNFEYNMIKSWGFSEAHLVRSNFNALQAAFLPEDEKKQLRETLLRAYGIE